MRWTWILGAGLLLGAPFACGSSFTSNSGGGGSGGGSTSTTSSGAGAGGPCQDVSECPSPSSQCETYACNGGTCVRTVLPMGPVPNPVVGNCVAEVCDGAGNQTTTPDDTDVFVDGNACTNDRCVNHSPQNPANPGMPCGGNRVCDDSADCVECLDPPSPNMCGPNRTCVANQCVSLTCANGMKDATNGETDVDCGGLQCAPCDDGKDCLLPRDCLSGVCSGTATRTCQQPTCNDNVQNGSESDIDCGGSCSKKCATGQGCANPSDCTSGVCKNGKCAAPTCNCSSSGGCTSGGNTAGDGVKNGNETDVDCGGPGCNPCHDGKHCGQDADCQTGHCDLSNANGTCDHCTDGGQLPDFGESDIDCGAACVAPHVPAGNLCNNGDTCFNDQDCQSGKCCDPGGGGPKTCQSGCG